MQLHSPSIQHAQSSMLYNDTPQHISDTAMAQSRQNLTYQRPNKCAQDASKTGLSQSKTQVLETKTPVLESKTRVLRSKRVFGDLKPGLAKSKHAKTKFKTPKTPILDPKTPVLEQGDSKNTSWKGLDGQGISEAIDSAGRQATDFTQVHRGTDLKGRTDSSKPSGRRKGIQSEDARNVIGCYWTTV